MREDALKKLFWERKSAEPKHTHEIIAKVSIFNFRTVNNSNTSDTTKHKVFESLGTSRTTIKQTYTSFLKRSLPLLTPDPVLTFQA